MPERSVGTPQDKVCVAILVHVTGRSGNPVTFDFQTNVFRDISKCPVPLVAVKFWRLAIIDDKQIHITPVVKICRYD